MSLPAISKRMQALIDFIDADVIADVGCDHAYVVCQAVQNGKARKGYAIDVASGPISRACQTIRDCHLEGSVIPQLQNGLVPLPDDLEQAVIAGMGGRTIIEILSAAVDSTGFHPLSLILSPHSDAPLLREWLHNNGYQIEKEKILFEDRHWYPVLYAVPGNVQVLTEEEMLYGRNPVHDRSRKEYLQTQLNKWNHILAGMPDQKKEKARHQVNLLEQILKEEK